MRESRGQGTLAGSAAPSRPGAPLRVGIIADARQQPRWLVNAMVRVAAAEFAEIVLVSVGRASPASSPWTLRLYDRFDRKFFHCGPDPSARVDLHSSLPPARFLPLADPRDGTTAAEWRARIAAAQLDVAFVLGEFDDAALDGLTRFGVWRYRFGEELDRAEARAAVGEATGASPVTVSALVARCGGGAPDRLVYRATSRTLQYSIARNRENVLRKATEFAARALRWLHRSGAPWLQSRPPVPAAQDGRAAAAGDAGIAGLLRLGARIARRGVEKAFTVEQWFIGYRFGGDERWSGDLRSYRLLMPPKDRFWADPFAFERAGRHYIFFEEFMFAAGKAHIVAVEVGRNGERSEPVRVLERPYHLSYPLLIEDGGELYMVPESGANRTVEVYRCARFPDDWRLEKVLLQGEPFVDATIHRAGGRWWMFVNSGPDGTELHDELHIYHADSLLGEWRPHAANPVKSDVLSARPAGRLFERDGALFRPAQVCAPLYGAGISINRVLRLTPDEYIEREEQQILPSHPEGLLGLHTVNRAGELFVIDAFRRRPLGSERKRAVEPGRLSPLHRTITEHADN